MVVGTVLVIFTIGLYALPESFAEYPDPDKDPRDYLIRYYTEPNYKDWFDSQFPNITIEEKVGYPNKIITEDYYVDQVFEFAVLLPSESYTIDPIAQSGQENTYGLFAVDFGGNEDWLSGYIVYYDQSLNDDIPARELEPDEIETSLNFWSFMPWSSVPEEEGLSVQLKINDDTYDSVGNFNIESDNVFKEFEKLINGSWEANDSNLFGEGL